MADFNSVPGYNLVTLLKRLEAATSRLEDLTIFQSQALDTKSGNSLDSTTLSESSNATAVPSPGTPAPAEVVAVPVPVASTPPEPVPEPIPASIKEFDEFIEDTVTPFVVLSKEIDPIVEEQSKFLESAFVAEREFLRIVFKSKKPTPGDVYFELFKPITAEVQKIQDIRENNRKSKFFNHLSTVSEGAPAIGWIGVEPTPVPFIGDFKDSAQFYSNRVLKDYKETDKKHVEWAQAYLKIITNLQAYVKKNHTTGPSWNAKGDDVEKVLKKSAEASSIAASLATNGEAATAAAAAAAPPPPPPPPPPPASVFQVSSEPAAPAGGINAVFAEINKGSSVTAGLKKVDKSQMTHKNPELRAQSIVPATSPKQAHSPALPTKPKSLKQKKPARVELEGFKWIVENFENNPEIIVEVELNHSVFIHNCKKSTIQIKGKFNTVTLNESDSTGLLVESLVSSVDVIKSNNFGLQVTGKLPTISVDQSDNGQIYLSKDSLEVEIYTSKSTGININVPDDTDDGEFKEQPVPEQLLHKIKDGRVVSEIVEHLG
ncbi:adenylate cyclase associated N terminal-domain-containing protein [Lipomyces japonicus]|uniref:adenylate cyclase associated N terminal-domain-containing protein n=1 Tax=Lipomyces japonicus TaxID=56871 RepID=UPI0034CD1AA8